MKKIVLTICATLLMSFTAMAQRTVTTPSQRVDIATCSAMSGTARGAAPVMPVMKDGTATKDCMFDAADGHARVFGFNVFDYRFRTNALVDFTTDNPQQYQMMVDYTQQDGAIGFFSATFVEDKIFAYSYTYWGQGAMVPHAMGFIDPQTGMFTETIALSEAHKKKGVVLSDLCYDPETKLVYGCKLNYDSDGWSTGYSTIYSIDPFKTEDTMTEVASVKGDLFTLSCDRGVLYSIVPIKKLDGVSTKDSKLIKMPLNTLVNGKIDVTDVTEGGLGVKIAWAQSMEIDKINHRLWWFGQSLDDEAFFAEVDMNTGKIKSRSDFSPVAQVVALAIPYQYRDAETPSYPLNLKAVSGTEGARTVQLSWTNPDKDYNLEALKGIKKVKVIRDGAVVGTEDATGMGAAQTFTDTNVPDGNHIYRISCTNDAGEGVYKEVKVFVGHDLPLGPTAISIKVDAGDPRYADVSWTAPDAGIYGGWIDKTTLKYDVVRYPDNVKVATDIAECHIRDFAEKSEGYYYEITSKNADGTGGTSKSEIVVFGPKQSIPFFSSLDTEEEFNKWKVIDNNHDLVTWKFGGTEQVANYDRAEGAADDYLVSPELQFEEGKKYQIRFKYWTINWVDPTDHSPILDKMKVYYAQEPTVEAFQKEGEFLDLGEFHTPSETYLYAKQVFTAKPGKGHVAFHACSDPYRSIIYLQNVSIREYSKTDLSVTDFRGSLTVPMEIPATYGVEVTNEGSSAVSDYKVELINSDTQEVLATAEGTPLRSGQKTVISVDWTPKATGMMNITARVNLEGDTYTDDNTWAEPIETKITGTGSDQWITVNKDDSYEDENGNAYNKGYAAPFNLDKGYSEIECIYLDKEMYKKDITLTGVKFVYDALDSDEGTIDVFVSAMNTEKNYFAWNEEYGAVEYVDPTDENWIKVFDGAAKLGGETYNREMEIKFTTPYYYEGGNIVLYYSYMGGGTYYGKVPMFHYHDMYDEGEVERQRTANISKEGTLYHIPFTQFSYKDGQVDGIMGVTAEGLNFDICGGTLTLSDACDAVTVYDVDGRVVAEAHDTAAVSLGSVHGTYVIKAVKGGKTINCKVTL